MKALMDMAGLRGGPVRPPLVDVNDGEKQELRAILETWRDFLD
jgi:dihydrodipicolinate synthase/N-acetylneuraminate lyase